MSGVRLLLTTATELRNQKLDLAHFAMYAGVGQAKLIKEFGACEIMATPSYMLYMLSILDEYRAQGWVREKAR